MFCQNPVQFATVNVLSNPIKFASINFLSNLLLLMFCRNPIKFAAVNVNFCQNPVQFTTVNVLSNPIKFASINVLSISYQICWRQLKLVAACNSPSQKKKKKKKKKKKIKKFEMLRNILIDHTERWVNSYLVVKIPYTDKLTLKHVIREL